MSIPVILINMGSVRDWRFCAYCGHRRRIYVKAHVSLLDVVFCAFLGLLVLTPIANGFDPRGFAFGAVFCAVAEVFVSIRHRLSLKCSKCGFDPVVYRRSSDDAVRMVKAHAKARADNPQSLLAEAVRPVKYRLKRRSDDAQQL